MAKVLVIGASRGIGLKCVEALLAAGHDVRALARHAHDIPLADPRLEKRDGDALDAQALRQALDGVDAVIQSLGVSFGPEAVLKGTTLFSKSTRILVDAMRETGVKRLIAVTGLGAGDSRGHGGFLYDAVILPLVLKRIYDDKDIAEQIIRQSDLDWTIARPGILTDAPASGGYRVLVEPKSWRGGSIARADVADFLVRQVRDTALIGKTPVLIA